MSRSPMTWRRASLYPDNSPYRTERKHLDFVDFQLTGNTISQNINTHMLSWNNMTETETKLDYVAKPSLDNEKSMPTNCRSFSLTITWDAHDHVPRATLEYVTLDDQTVNIPTLRDVHINFDHVMERDPDDVRPITGPMRQIQYVEEETHAPIPALPSGYVTKDWNMAFTREQVGDRSPSFIDPELSRRMEMMHDRRDRERKARELLMSFLTKKEKDSILGERVTIESKTLEGVMYKVNVENSLETVDVIKNNHLVDDICVVPRASGMPEHDGALAKILLLKSDEELFFKTANQMSLFKRLKNIEEPRRKRPREEFVDEVFRPIRSRLEPINIDIDDDGIMHLS